MANSLPIVAKVTSNTLFLQKGSQATYIFFQQNISIYLPYLNIEISTSR